MFVSLKKGRFFFWEDIVFPIWGLKKKMESKNTFYKQSEPPSEIMIKDICL